MTKPVEVNGVTIGNGLPKICVPLTGKKREELLEEASRIRAAAPDLVEWRADYYEHLNCEEDFTRTLKEIKEELGDLPLIFTIRSAEGGGNVDISEEEYAARALEAAESGCAELIDVEVFSRKDIDQLIEKIHTTGAKVIASSHDFHKTDDSEILKKRFLDMNSTGADILKMAVMPTEFDDVASLMQVTNEMVEEHTEKPVISMAMGNLGSISRIAGENFGSAVTFAVIGAASAPGQFPIEELRMMMNVLHKKNIEEN